MKRTNCAATMRRFGDSAKRTCAAFLSAVLVASALVPCALAAEVPDAVMPDEPVAGESAETEFKLVIEDSQIKVTAPTDVVFYVGADGDFTCPTNAYIENGSIFGIEMWGVEVTPETGASYELTVSPNGGAALSLAEEGLFIASDTQVDEDWAGTTPTKTDTMVRSQWSMAATDNQEDGTGKASGEDYIALTFEGSTDAADALSSGAATKVAQAAWHFKAGGVAGDDSAASTDIVTTDDMSAAPYAILTLDEAATASAGVDRYAMTFVRSADAVTTSNTYNGAAITAVYDGIETTQYDAIDIVPEWYADKNYKIVTSVTVKDKIKPVGMGGWFYGMSSLTSMEGLENIDTSEVASMNSTFGAYPLDRLNLSSWNTTNVTGMYGMFFNCAALMSLDVSGFNTSRVTDMYGMFSGCSSLTELDLSGFDTGLVTGMSTMFYKCSNLESITFGDGWNTSNVTDMNGMFSGCSSLTELDLSGFDTGLVTGMSTMFQSCSSLTTIYASDLWSTAALSNGTSMFCNCTSLKGGNGTTYNSSHQNAEYAVIDAEGTPGYLTYKAAPSA